MSRLYLPKVLKIGELYDEAHTSLPEGSHVHINEGGMAFRVSVSTWTDGELAKFHRGRFCMRLVSAPHTLLFLARFGDEQRMDAPFSVHRVPDDERLCPPDPPEGHGWLLTLIAVDSDDGVVTGLRQLTLSRSFSRAVLREYQKQFTVPADEAAHAREYARFRTKSTTSLANGAMDRFEGDGAGAADSN